MSLLPDASFVPAPLARRLTVILVLVVALIAIFDIIAAVQMRNLEGSQRWILLLAVLPAWLIVLGIWFGARIRVYEIVDSSLVVRRLWRSPRISLVGLQSATPLGQALTGVRKIWGNDGLGAISGTFTCKEWGTFQMFVSDPSKAVVLHCAGGERVLVSPADTEGFVASLRPYLR